MLTHSTFPVPPLVELSDLLDGTLPAGLRSVEQPLRDTLDWARDYLCRPHPELGRKGNVCPFVDTALSKGTFYMAVRSGVPTEVDEVVTTLGYYRDWFLELPRRGAMSQFTTFLVLFPDIGAEHLRTLIDGTQQALKSSYVTEGLMIGEFHEGPPDKAGLWNADFRPLHSPVPMLVIRHMVPTDFPFLHLDDEQVAAYLRLFRSRIPPHLHDQVNQAAARQPGVPS